MAKQPKQALKKSAAAQTDAKIATVKLGGEGADALLKADHRKVEELFKTFQQTDDDEQKAGIARQICSELMIHALLEEEIFYRACRDKGVEDDTLDEAQVEHDGAKVLIRELLTEEPGAPFYDAKVKVLSEYIKHHVGEEEKSDGIFAKAREKSVDMAALGQRLKARKEELTAMAEADRLQPPRFRALQSNMFTQEDERMNRQMSGRDEEGRFTSGNGGRGGGRGRQMQSRYRDDDDDDRRSSRGRGSQDRERDEYGRFMSDDDDDRRSSRGRGSQDRERDEYGRFMSDEDDDRRSSRGRQSSGRYEEDDDDRRSSRGRGQGGWFGDSEGHAEASRRGWETRYEEDDGRRSSSRGRSRDDDDDDRRMSSRSRGSSSRSRDDDDEDGRGWFGDPEGHSKASRKGWEHRESQGGSRSMSRSSSASRSRDDDDRRSSRSGGSRGGQGQGGWFGDSRGHAEAARRGWENR